MFVHTLFDRDAYTLPSSVKLQYHLHVLLAS